jgi:signal transduction histidine kinase
MYRYFKKNRNALGIFITLSLGIILALFEIHIAQTQLELDSSIFNLEIIQFMLLPIFASISVVFLILYYSTKEKRGELYLSQIEDNEERLRIILEQMPVGIILAKATNGEFFLYNKSAINIVGNSFIRQGTKSLLKEDGTKYEEESSPVFITLKNSESVVKNDLYVMRDDKTLLNIRMTSAPIINKENKTEYIIIVVEDTSRERQIEKSKSEFVSIASHQLRTPLTGIKWFSELLISGKATELTNKQKDFVVQIHDSNDRMIKLVENLLNVSRIETGGKFTVLKKPVDILEILKSIKEDVAGLLHSHEIELIENIKNIPKINADHDKLREAIGNIISNAIKYSHNGGKVSINGELKDNKVIITVSDSGLGIPISSQEKVFQKFFRAENVQTKETDGTGLGLYITKAIIEAHGGKLTFSSIENEGTTFYIELPII